MLLDKNFWNKRRVLITGATGFVGSWLSKLLVNNDIYSVAFLKEWDPQSLLIASGDINKMHVAQGCVSDFSSLERAINEHQIDTIFHFAAQAIVGAAYRSPLSTFETNIRGTYHVLEASRRCKKHVKRVIISSSDKAYGHSDIQPYLEEMPTIGTFPYDVSKSCADLLATSYFKSYQLPVTIARCGNIYGGGDLNWSRLIPKTIRSLHHNSAPTLRSDGKFSRDFLFIEDAVQAFITLAEKSDKPAVVGEAFNFSPSRPYHVLEIVHTLRRLMNKEELLPIVCNNTSHEIQDQHLSSDKAHKLLGWKACHSIEDGLRATISWYKKYFSQKKSNLENQTSLSR